jgi:hypothetical protein
MSNTGGPAYPTRSYTGIQPLSTGYSEGMSLRDDFAAKAMAAILTDGSWHGHTCSTTAKTAYIMADAMLKAREA